MPGGGGGLPQRVHGNGCLYLAVIGGGPAELLLR
jgi:hypothetical protein